MLKALALDATDTPIKRQRFGDPRGAEALANFGNRIDLLAVEAPAEVFAGPPVMFKLYWRLHGAPLERDFSSIIRMRDPQGFVVAEASAFTPGGLATSNWLPGAYVEDVIELALPPFTPSLPAAYTFDVSLYDNESLRALSLYNDVGNPQDVKYQLVALPLRRSDLASEALRSPRVLGEDLALLIDAPQLPDQATAAMFCESAGSGRNCREAGRTQRRSCFGWTKRAMKQEAAPLCHWCLAMILPLGASVKQTAVITKWSCRRICLPGATSWRYVGLTHQASRWETSCRLTES